MPPTQLMPYSAKQGEKCSHPGCENPPKWSHKTADGRTRLLCSEHKDSKPDTLTPVNAGIEERDLETEKMFRGLAPRDRQEVQTMSTAAKTAEQVREDTDYAKSENLTDASDPPMFTDDLEEKGVGNDTDPQKLEQKKQDETAEHADKMNREPDTKTHDVNTGTGWKETSSLACRVFCASREANGDPKVGSKVMIRDRANGEIAMGTVAANGENEFAVLWDDEQISVEQKTDYEVVDRTDRVDV